MDKVKFSLGEVVYLKIMPDKSGMITGILFLPSGVSYFVTWGDMTERRHYDCELTAEKAYVNSGEA